MTKIKITDISIGTIETNKTKKVKAASKIKLIIPLKEIPSEYWDKVKVGNDWDREYVEAQNDVSFGWEGSRAVPMTPSESSDSLVKVINRRFKTQELLDNYKKYVDTNKKIFHHHHGNVKGKFVKSKSYPDLTIGEFKADTHFSTHLPTQLTQFLREANKLFIQDGHGKTTSQEAFKFLKSIVESKEIKSQVKFIPGDEITLGEWLKYRDSSNNGDQIELTPQEATELGISNTIINQPSPSQPVITQPTSPSTPTDYQQIKETLTKWTDKFKGKSPEQVEKEINDLISSNNGKLPTDLPPNWRDQLARLPFLEKATQDLTIEKNKIEKESKARINILNSDLQNKDDLNNSLQTDLSQIRAENDHLKNYTLKTAQEKLAKWENTFKDKMAYEVERELNKPKLTPEQQDKINNYDEIKRKWEEWTKAFPATEFSTPEQARAKYDEAIRNQKPLEHDKIREDLNEWKLAFSSYNFPNKKPQDIRNDYDKLVANQKPTDYEQLKNDLERWANAFGDPEFKGKAPSEIKAVIEKYKDDLKLRESELLSKHRGDINRLVDNNIGRLKHIGKDSLNNKYGGKTVDQIAEGGLTLENVTFCIQNLHAVMAICATEKAVEWGKQIENMSTDDDNRATQITEIVDFLPKIESLWKRVPISVEKNNPFYLADIENKATYTSQISNLITTWSAQKRILFTDYETEIFVANVEQNK